MADMITSILGIVEIRLGVQMNTLNGVYQGVFIVRKNSGIIVMHVVST